MYPPRRRNFQAVFTFASVGPMREATVLVAVFFLATTARAERPDLGSLSPFSPLLSIGQPSARYSKSLDESYRSAPSLVIYTGLEGGVAQRVATQVEAFPVSVGAWTAWGAPLFGCDGKFYGVVVVTKSTTTRMCTLAWPHALGEPSSDALCAGCRRSEGSRPSSIWGSPSAARDGGGRYARVTAGSKRALRRPQHLEHPRVISPVATGKPRLVLVAEDLTRHLKELSFFFA